MAVTKTPEPCDLTDVPGIGPKKAALLQEMGYGSLDSLRGEDADDIYARAQLTEGRPLDKCVLYAFRCAVAYSEDPEPDPAAYRWWHFSDNAPRR